MEISLKSAYEFIRSDKPEEQLCMKNYSIENVFESPSNFGTAIFHTPSNNMVSAKITKQRLLSIQTPTYATRWR